MQSTGAVDEAADSERIAAVILAAIQGGLVVSQPEGSAWPLEAALDTPFLVGSNGVLPGRRTSAAAAARYPIRALLRPSDRTFA